MNREELYNEWTFIKCQRNKDWTRDKMSLFNGWKWFTSLWCSTAVPNHECIKLEDWVKALKGEKGIVQFLLVVTIWKENISKFRKWKRVRCKQGSKKHDYLISLFLFLRWCKRRFHNFLSTLSPRLEIRLIFSFWAIRNWRGNKKGEIKNNS